MFEVPLPKIGDSGGALVDGMADQLEVRLQSQSTAVLHAALTKYINAVNRDHLNADEQPHTCTTTVAYNPPA